MVKHHVGRLSRPGPDFLTQELATVLSGAVSFEFKPLFTVVYANLRASNHANGGEETMRLRVYEKLQALVYRGMVSKVITGEVKEYLGLASLMSMLPILVVGKAAEA